MSEFWDLFGEWALDANGDPKPLSVKTFEGVGSHGQIWAAPHDMPGLIQIPQGGKLVRGGQGDLVTSTLVVYADLSDAGRFTLDSLVTPADGREAPVVAISTADVQGMFGGFVAVTLG